MALMLPACTAPQPAVRVRPDRTVLLPPGFAVAGNDTDAKSGLPRRIRQVELDYEMVLVPAGPFTVTSFDTLTGARLTRSDSIDAFYIGTATVSNAQYHRYRPYHESAAEDSSPLNADTAPVLDLHWEQARDFCDWAGMALPGETQWLKAVHGTRPRAAGRRHAGGQEHFIVRPQPAFPEWCTDSVTYCLFPRDAADTAADARQPVVRADLEESLDLLQTTAKVAGIMGESMLAGTPLGWAYLGIKVLHSFPDWFIATRAIVPVERESLP